MALEAGRRFGHFDVLAPLGAGGMHDGVGRLATPTALAGLALGVLMASHAGLFIWARRTAGARIPAFTRLTFQRGAVDSARFSPDGQTVVYSARWQGGPSEVFSQRLGSADARP